MVGQDVRERRDVVQQRVERAVRQGVEGRVRGREDGEVAGAGERVDKARGLNGGHERGQVGRGDGEVDDAAGTRARDAGIESASGAVASAAVAVRNLRRSMAGPPFWW
jgi:hypothetical protein